MTHCRDLPFSAVRFLLGFCTVELSEYKHPKTSGALVLGLNSGESSYVARDDACEE